MSELTLQQEIEARKPATEGTLRQMASELAMVSAKESMDSAKTAWDGLLTEEGADLNG